MSQIKIISTDDVLEALRLWHGGEITQWPLAKLRLGLQLTHEQEDYSSLADAEVAARNRAILNFGLERLRSLSPQGEELLRQRFEHRRDVLDVANSINVVQSSLYYRQRQAINQLTEILLQLEEEASNDWQERMTSRLDPPTYLELTGVDESRSQLSQILLSEEDYFIVSIDGLGGLGKTALAHQITLDLIHTLRFEEIAWVTAKQTHLSSRGRLQVDSGQPALTFPMLIDQITTQFELPENKMNLQLQKQRLVKKYLQERACLIIIDNLETTVDYRTLLPELRQWQKPSKFLLTSRVRLLDEPGVFSYSLPELSEISAFQLMRLEAQKSGFTSLANATDTDLKQIYDIVGGNPLALKLVVGQLRFHSLPRVLSRLAESQSNESGIGLFDYIYREAWESLTDESKTTLISLTQAGDSGFALEHIVDISGLTPIQAEQCLEELILLSLVDQKGTLLVRKYSLHRLTEIFLLKMFAET
ncbi:MAG: hypothetical protein GY796_09570 [Chloroflexi bacterium]|nr:hypothetical protein [Chloroflexota bacterium]